MRHSHITKRLTEHRPARPDDHRLKDFDDHQHPDDQADTFQHPHASAGHYDEIHRIEELRRTQQNQVRDTYQADQAATRPASLPYLRRASHRP